MLQHRPPHGAPHPRPHHRPCQSFRCRCTQVDSGHASQGLERSRGGFSTKTHSSVAALGNPLRYPLKRSDAHDVTQARRGAAPVSRAYVIADRAYNSGLFLGDVIQRGALRVIPPRARRSKPHAYAAKLHLVRHLLECCIGKIKQFCRIVSRFDKQVRRHLAFLVSSALLSGCAKIPFQSSTRSFASPRRRHRHVSRPANCRSGPKDTADHALQARQCASGALFTVRLRKL